MWRRGMFDTRILEDNLPIMVDESQGQYGSVAIAFSKILQTDDALSSLGADGVQFLIACIIESYVALADWEALELWLHELQTLRVEHASKAYAGALTTAGHDMNSIHSFDASSYCPQLPPTQP
ncbi:hypothetical protein GOP47_0014282 [Adiantum capillus-veneris]|uniref:Uncharacterized protein n=1 Tax=Adiantum capillus-veneris TaxID=13818 RepID=A0A9D4ZCB6_ADICA|nr:hypothetical protein GOP47_0014282 [Adiantum capillus-veneris]